MLVQTASPMPPSTGTSLLNAVTPGHFPAPVSVNLQALTQDLLFVKGPEFAISTPVCTVLCGVYKNFNV
jgi:hypothetical protein